MAKICKLLRIYDTKCGILATKTQIKAMLKWYRSMEYTKRNC